MPIKMDDLIEALSISDASDQIGFVVYLNKQTGETYTDYNGDKVGLREAWWKFEEQAKATALREFCEEEGVDLV